MKSESSNKIWYLIRVSIGLDVDEITSSILFDLGATGIITFEEDENHLKLGAYFDEGANPEDLRRQIEAEFARNGKLSSLNGITISETPDQDWMQKWKENFEPIKIGRRLLVAPSWKLPEDTEGRAVIQIDPGMAFGTGTHETTQLCLEAIEKHWQGKTLIDVGTGTAILAIGAALLVSNSQITAIDIDPLAIAIARENIKINKVEKMIEVVEGGPERFSTRPFDMVVANLTAEVIIALTHDLVNCLNPSGVLILSGILTEFREDVEKCLMQTGLKIIERNQAGEWSLLVAQRGES